MPEIKSDVYTDERLPEMPCAADAVIVGMENAENVFSGVRIEAKRGDLINKILEAYELYYKEKNSRNHTYKRVFFYAILAMLGAIILGFAAAGIILAARGAAWRDALPLLGGGTATLLAALIILPQIIATHLFPVKEDQVIVDLIAVLRGISPYALPRGETRSENDGRS